MRSDCLVVLTVGLVVTAVWCHWRKDRSLEVNDHIIVSFEAESSVLHDAVQAWVDYTKAETLAVDVHKTPIGDADKVVEICVHHVAVQVRKV